MLDQERLRQWWDALKRREEEHKRLTMAEMRAIAKGQRISVPNRGIETKGLKE